MLRLILISAGALIAFRLIGAALPRLWRPLALIGKIVCVTGLALLAAFGCLLATFGFDAGAWGVTGAGVAIAILSLRMILQLWYSPATTSRERPTTSPSHLPEKPEEDIWSALAAKVRWHRRSRIAAIRHSITAFLDEKGSPSFSTDHLALAVSLESRVPQLIRECLERCKGDTSAECRRKLQRTLAQLEGIAADADCARQEVRQADDRGLEALHHYFDAVSARRS